ncbi:hypothetical protein [Sphingomonas melonis]|uniref:hypothetical protein n=1 Tax=Sphingomonas melonis TaxID=152682 RepID=UPI000A7BA403|nr:hypothetical protein [Sphingomonas melonis]
MRTKAKRAAATPSVEVNPGCLPDPANPHSWLVLTGDDADRDATRVMYGCLRPSFRGHLNSAAAFAAAKLTVGAPPDTPPWTLTAARAEVLLPPGADDRLSDPRILMETVDAELPVKAKALLAYLTFTFPTRDCMSSMSWSAPSPAGGSSIRSRSPHCWSSMPPPGRQRQPAACSCSPCWTQAIDAARLWRMGDAACHRQGPCPGRNAFRQFQADWRQA